jgi:aspartyl protease family protein
MGKVIEKVKIANLFEPAKSIEIEAVIDTGATMLVLPQDLVDGLGLRKIRDARVKYANNKVESKWVYGAVTVEIKGRLGIFEVLSEEVGSQPLVGQIILEALDLIVEPATRMLVPNPRSPEMPMVEILITTVSS